MSTTLFGDFLKLLNSQGFVGEFLEVGLEKKQQSLEEFAASLMGKIVSKLEKKCDPNYIELTNDSTNLQVKLTTKGLFRGDTITSEVSDIIDNLEIPSD